MTLYEGAQPLPCLPGRVYRVLPAPNEVPHGFIVLAGDVHRCQFTQPVEPSKGNSIAPVGFGPVPAPLRCYRRRNDGEGFYAEESD